MPRVIDIALIHVVTEKNLFSPTFRHSDEAVFTNLVLAFAFVNDFIKRLTNISYAKVLRNRCLFIPSLTCQPWNCLVYFSSVSTSVNCLSTFLRRIKCYKYIIILASFKINGRNTLTFSVPNQFAAPLVAEQLHPLCCVRIISINVFMFELIHLIQSAN